MLMALYRLECTEQIDHVRLQSSNGSYRSLCQHAKVELEPLLGLQTHAPGKYIVHAEDQGAPRCIAVLSGAGDHATVFANNTTFNFPKEFLQGAALKAIDASSIITFKVGVGAEQPSTKALERLLDMRAGAKTPFQSHKLPPKVQARNKPLMGS